MAEANEGELERLREENERLKARQEELEHRSSSAVQGGRKHIGRWTAAVVLLALGALLLAAASVTVWANRTLLDTTRYTATVAPLAADPAIQESVANAVGDRLFAAADVESRVRAALPTAGPLVAAPVAQATHTLLLNGAHQVVTSPRFATFWTEANERGHAALVRVLKGETQHAAVGIENGSLTLDMTKVVQRVKAVLAERGVGVVERVPDSVAGGTFVLFQSDALAQAQSAVRLLQQLAIALPVLALLSLVAAVLVAPDRRRGLLWAGVAVMVSMLVVGAALALGRQWYVGSAQRVLLDAAGAGAFFDIMVRFLRNGIRTIAVLGLLMVLGSALAGPSSGAVRLRGGVTHGLSGFSEATGLDLGPFATWVAHYRKVLEVAIVVIAAVVLLSAEAPTPGLVLGLAVGAAVGFAFVELLARAHGHEETRPDEGVFA